jgi:hypothetical protein
LRFAEDFNFSAAEPVPLRHLSKSNKESSTKTKILQPAEHQADPLQRILLVPPKLSFKRLILETPLWQHTMSSNLKSPPKGLMNSECKKGKLVAQPPILYVPPTNLHKRQETELIKVKMPDGTNFQMAAFAYGNNEEYIVDLIAVLCIIEQKGMALDITKAFHALVEVRREMTPLFEFPEDKTEAEKEIWKQSLSKYKEILKAKRSDMAAEAQKAYEVFCCFIVGNPRTQWDKIVREMHTKDPWIGMNGSSNKGPRVCSWPSFMDCIELHKLTIFPVDAAEKQSYYMTQRVKKPQWATVRQYMACMGTLNDYLTFLPMVFNSSMAVEGTKKGNVPFDEADLARIVLNSVPVSWMNQYNMTHPTLPNGTRTLLQDLESIKRVMEERHEAGLKAKAKGASASTTTIAKGTSKKCSASGNPGERVPNKVKPNKLCQHCKAKGGPHLTHNTKECPMYNGGRGRL